MFLPPPTRSQYSILVRVGVGVRLRARGRCRCRVRTRLRLGVGVRVRVGFQDGVGVQSAHGFLRAAPLATNCWPEGGGGGAVGVLGPAEPLPL